MIFKFGRSFFATELRRKWHAHSDARNRDRRMLGSRRPDLIFHLQPNKHATSKSGNNWALQWVYFIVAMQKREG
jgi:hypothetical protein